MPIVLACAVDGERSAVCAGLGLPKNAAAGRTIVANGREAALLLTGIGPVNAAWRLGELLPGVPGVTGVVNLGIAGSYDPARAPLLAPVAATAEIWPEFGLRSGEDVDAAALKFPLHAKGPIRDAIRLDPDRDAAALGLILPASWARAPSVTVAGVSAQARRAAHLAASRQALTENMEGFPLALICHDKGLPFLEVRVVSNLAGSRAAADWRVQGALRELGRVAAVLFGLAEQA
jgi:futalosine hydrolase